MRYKEFGRTGIKLSVFGYGGAKYRNTEQLDKNIENVQYAFSKGINHFDSCPGYANSEELFSRALRDCKRDTYYMSTKNQPLFINSRQEALDGIKRSLENMKLDYFDFYYLWNVKRIDEYHKAVSISDHYQALLDAKSEGLIKHIALSSHLNGFEASEIIDDGKIEGILLNFNILNFPYTIMAAKRAMEKGIGVGAMSPLAGGMIPMHEDKMQFLSIDGMSPTDTALEFVSGLDFINYSYIGFKEKSEIDEASRIADMNFSLSDSDVEAIRRLVGDGLNDACTGCMYCMDHCPNFLPISEYMTFYNYKHVFNMDENQLISKLKFAEDWFMLAKRKADAKDCIKCGNCEAQCPQKINIRDRLSEIAQWEMRF